MPLLEWFKSAIEAEYHIAVTLGLLLGASVLAGFLSNLIRLPTCLHTPRLIGYVRSLGVGYSQD